MSEAALLYFLYDLYGLEIYDLRSTRYDIGMFQFENLTIRVSSSIHSPLQRG